MRKWILALIATGVVFMGGCSSPQNVPPLPVIETPVINVEEVFISTIEAEYGDATPDQERVLIEFGYAVCNNAPDWDRIAVEGANSPDPHMYGYIMGAAVASFCPQYSDSLIAWGSTSSQVF